MNRQFDLRPRAVGRRAKSHAAPPARMVLCLHLQGAGPFHRASPIIGERLLIGGDPHCDVCLSGQKLPDLHTILSVEGSSAWAEVVVAEPPLRVNGVETERRRLKDGDVLEIGATRLEVRFNSALMPTAAIRWPVSLESSMPHDPEFSESLKALSAEQLIDLIESEQAEVDAFESGRNMGMRALMKAAKSRRPKNASIALHAPEASPEAHREEDLTNQMNDLSEQLERLSERLVSRSEELADREDRFVQAAAELEQIQRQIDARLGQLRGQSGAGERLRKSPRRAA